ncbi:hypothetical protein V6N12_069764 [Hibiscus sabdariffa]|uniref:Uncharacterized protein n=1 Tax=Hibiscus sabdariffa TaxID=183260 RepID=A0ABR2FEV4_9ROSI
MQITPLSRIPRLSEFSYHAVMADGESEWGDGFCLSLYVKVGILGLVSMASLRLDCRAQMRIGIPQATIGANRKKRHLELEYLYLFASLLGSMN